MLKVNILIIGTVVLGFNLSILFYSLRPFSKEAPNLGYNLKDAFVFEDDFNSSSYFDANWRLHFPLGDRPNPDFHVKDGRLNFRYEEGGEYWDQPGLLSEKSFNADKNIITIHVKDIKVRPDFVFGLKYNQGTTSFHVEEFPEKIPIPQTARHRIRKPSTKIMDVWLVDNEYDRVLFAVKNKPPISHIRLRIQRNVISYTYFFNHKNISTVVGEVETTMSGPFKLYFYSLQAGECSVGSVSVSTYHGECLTPLLCRCYPPYIGPDCDTIHESNTPHADQLVPINKEEYYYKQEHRDKSLEKLFVSEIDKIQLRKNCKEINAIVVYLPNNVGLWSDLHHLMYLIDWGYRTNRTVIDARHDEWQIARNCKRNSFNCFFKSVSACTEYDIMRDADDHPVNLDYGHDLKRRTLNFWDKFYWERDVGYHSGWGGWDPDPLIDVVPDMFLEKDPSLSPIWWRAQMLKYLVRPHPIVIQKLEDIMNDIGWTWPIISMHIRGTDKVGSEMEPVSVMRYLDKMELIREWFGVNTVYIASDDNDVLVQMVTLVELKGFTAIFNSREKRFKEGAVPLFSKQTENTNFDPTEAAQDAIVNVLLLSQANFFVGTFSSNMGRAAYELLISTYGQHSIGVSLDIDWTERVC
eukprot:TRINITY_DN2665_c0_g1_i1.p1 TRINITY_DN2665_c0_g1~~TRINITY_DN2665_c0_g1_i1.p1  ORF type:complete len:636 (+),score=135.83 TRINITY_DN2665_c0_g1_i1:46-1953(+)